MRSLFRRPSRPRFDPQGLFPATVDEWFAMFACYAMVAVLWWMAVDPDRAANQLTNLFLRLIAAVMP